MFDNIMFDEEILFTYIGYAAGLAKLLTGAAAAHPEVPGWPGPA